MQKDRRAPLHVDKKILITHEEMQQILSCGYRTADLIGRAANADVRVGGRVLWSREALRKYVEEELCRR